MTTKLLESAKTLVNMWDCDGNFSMFEFATAFATLRQAIKEAEVGDAMQERELQDEAVIYTPMTDDEFQRIASSKSDVMHNGGWELLYTIYGVAVERAVIERLGLVWGGE